MPDSPYVYGTQAPRAVEPGGSRLRVFRRRAPARGEASEEARGSGDEAGWRALLAEAVAELDDAFERAGTPWRCRLEEDEEGFVLRVSRPSADQAPGPADEVEEVLDPADLPAWLARLRARLGLLVDERV